MGYQRMMADCIDEGESFVYDTILPAVLALQPPEQRKAFNATVDFDLLKVRSAKLYANVTGDALSLDEADRKEQQQKLADLNTLEGHQDSLFKPQLHVSSIMGLHEPGTSRTSTTAQGLDVPMGVLSAGGGGPATQDERSAP